MHLVLILTATALHVKIIATTSSVVKCASTNSQAENGGASKNSFPARILNAICGDSGTSAEIRNGAAENEYVGTILLRTN